MDEPFVYDRICVDGKCHCDWRVRIYDCEEEHAMYIIYIINAAFSALVTLMGAIILFHRVILKGHGFFEVNSPKGCLRPKPIDCMLLQLTIFNFLRLLTSVFLVTGVAANNNTAREFIFEFAWPFGYGGFALYLVGIAQTLADSHTAISSGWLPSPIVVDIIGSAIFLTPFILNVSCAIATGAVSSHSQYAADALARTHYVLWFVHCCDLTAAVLFSGTKLVRILNGHLAKIAPGGPRYEAIKTGIFKIRAVMGTIALCLMLFAVQCILYGILRHQILTSTPGSIVLSIFWTYLGPAACFCVEVAVIFNPNTNGGNLLKFGKTSSNEKSSANAYETDYSSAACGPNSHEHSRMPISRGTLEELKQQHQMLTFQRDLSEQSGMSSLDDTASNDMGNIPLRTVLPVPPRPMHKKPKEAPTVFEEESAIDHMTYSSRTSLVNDSLKRI